MSGGGRDFCKGALFALLFELVGTFFLVYTISGAYNSGGTLILVLTMFTLIGFRISAAHFNPAITFASLFKRNRDRFERRIALFYMLFQSAGAFGGALFALLEYGAVFPMLVFSDSKIFQAILIEIIGTFAYVLIHMIATDTLTRFSRDDLLNSFAIGISLGVVNVWGLYISGSCFNPAVGLFLNIARLF